MSRRRPLLASFAATAMVATSVVVALPLLAVAVPVAGQADDTAGVFIYNAGTDTEGFVTPPPNCNGLPAMDPTNDIINAAVTAEILFFIGDEANEVISWNLGADLERAGGLPDAAIEDVTLGLEEIDDYGDIANGSDDSANYDAQTGGDVSLQLDLIGTRAAPGAEQRAFIVPDGIVSTGVLGNGANGTTASLDGAEIFIFEDAELSGYTVDIYGPGGAGPVSLAVVDYQRNPNTFSAADDTLIAIDLDSLPGFTFPWVESITITDDNVAVVPNQSTCPVGTQIDTSLEIDAVATRTDTVLPGIPAVDIEKATNGQDADLPTGPQIPVGTDVTWDYVVTNSGEAELVDITVTDDQGVTIVCPSSGTNVIAGPMAVGASETCTGTGSAAAGQYTNNATVIATPISTGGFPLPGASVTDADPSNYLGVAAAVDIEKATNGADSDSAPGENIALGAPVVWTYVVTNNGTAALADLTVVDSQGVAVNCGAGGNIVDGPLLPGESFECTGTGSAVFGQYTNDSTVSATPVDAAGVPLGLPAVSDADPSNYFGVIMASIGIEKSTNGQDADAAPGPSIQAGDAVTWEYVVTNTGNTSLIDVTLTDSQGETIDCAGNGNVVSGVLAPTDSATCTATGTAGVGAYNNVGSVVGIPADAAGNPIAGATPVDASDPSNYLGVAEPAVDIEKSTNGQDADVAPGPALVVGEDVAWSYVVTNTGDTSLIDLVVTDDQGVAVDCGGGSNEVAGPIAPGASFTCDGSGLATAGQYENNATVLGTPATAAGVAIPGLPAATDSDPSHYVGLVANISLQKSTNDIDADAPTGPAINVGDAVTWRYTVSNTGQTTLIDVTVTDDQGASIDCGEGTANVINELLAGASVDCFANGTAEFGQYANLGTVVGQPVDAAGAPVGAPVNDDDPSHYIGTAEPAVSIEKSTNGEDADTPTGPSLVVGDVVTWTYVVTNTGNTNLIDITVTDDQLADSEISCEGGGNTVAGPLSPNATATCVADLFVSSGQYANVGSVTATPADAGGVAIAGLPAETDTDPSHYIGLIPSLNIEKATNGQDADSPVGPQIPVGDPVDWTYVVTNDGLVDMIDVVVTDDQGVTIDCGQGTANSIASLAAGAAVTCSASGIAELGQYANVGSATGQPVNAAGAPVGPTTTVQDPSHYFGTGGPAITIEKATNGQDADAPSGPSVPIGDPVDWTYVVTNTGDTPLVNVTVTDDQGVAVSCEGGGNVVAGPIAPAGVVNCTASGTATAGQYVNVGSVTGDPVDGNGDPLTDPSGALVPSPTDDDPSHYFGVDPSVQIIKSVNGADANTPPGVNVATGSTLNWTFLVTNTGNVNLTAVTVNDPSLATVVCPGGTATEAGPIAPGGSFTCTATSVAAAGAVTNLADVVATPVGPDGASLPTVVDDDPANYFGGDSAIDIEKSTNGADADSPTGPVLVVGDTVTWTYVVTNTGTVGLDNVTVTDDVVAAANIDCDAGSNTLSTTLAPAASVTCTATGTVAPGQYANTGSVTGDPTVGGLAVVDEDPSHYLGAQPSIDIEKDTNGLQSDTAPGEFIPVGVPITWTYVVTNTGNTDLGNVIVLDDQGVTVTCPVDALTVGGSMSCTGTGVAAAGAYSNVGSVSGVPLNESGAQLADSGGNPFPPLTATDPSNYFGADPSVVVEKETNGVDADAPTGPVLGRGDTVAWTYIVTNSGNVDLINVSVADDQGVTVDCGGSNVIGSLTAGQSITCTGSGTAELGQYANLGSVSGTAVDASGAPILDADGLPLDPVTDDDPSHYFGVGTPAIDVVKLVNDADANVAPGVSLVTGDPVTWTYVVSNTGDVNLVNAVVTDDQGVVVDCGQGTGATIASLPVAGVVTCTGTGTVVDGAYVNIGGVTADPVDEAGNPLLDETGAAVASVSDTDPANYFGGLSAIDIEKSTNGDDADAAPGPSLLAGDAVTWTYVVTNNGNLDLTDVLVSDDQSVTITCPSGNPIPALAVGISETCTASGVAVDGPYENTGTAAGTDANGTAVNDTDMSHYTAVDPAVTIEKDTNGDDADAAPGPSVAVGAAVTWTYLVTNTGSAVLTNVTVTDSIVADTAIDCGAGSNVVASLAVGANVTCSAAGVATAGQYTNLGSVTGQPVDAAGAPIGGPATDDDPSNYFGGAPGLTLEKTTNGADADTPTGPIVAVDDAISWIYTVTNSGNLALNDVTVTDDIIAASAIDCGAGSNVIGTLAAGATATCTASGVATGGQYANTGTVVGSDINGATSTATDPSHYFGTNPSINVEKATNGSDSDAAPGLSIQVGEAITWTYVVMNTGNVELQDVSVTDDQLAPTDITCEGVTGNTIASLAVDASVTCTATGAAVLGGYTNTATATGTPIDPNGDPVPGGPVSDDDPSNYTGTAEPVGNIGDTVWADLNADGVIDADEPRLSGVTVSLLDDSGTVLATAVTDDNGEYNFGDLVAGTYSVKVDPATLPAGYTQTFDSDGTLDDTSSTTLAAGASDLDQDFGYIPPGELTLEKSTNGSDHDIAPGVTVQVGDAVTWTFEVTNSGPVTITNIVVTDDKIAGTEITCTGASDNTIASLAPAASVACTAAGVAVEGLYTNTGTATGEDPLGKPVTDDDPSNYTGTPIPLGTIGDLVWLDANRDGNPQASEARLEGIEVQLLDAAGAVVQTTTTNADGLYLFGSVPAGDYTVKVIEAGLPAGAVQTVDAEGPLDNMSMLTLAAGAENLLQDFGYVLPDGVIGDTVWFDLNQDGVLDDDEVGIADITVQLIDEGGAVLQTAVTDTEGKYLFTGVAGGTYTVKVITAGSVLDGAAYATFDATAPLDNMSTVTLPEGGTDLDQDFGYVPPAGIGNFVFADTDGDGVQDTGEAGVAGAVVNLFTVDSAGAVSAAPISTVTTTASGEYLFDKLDPRLVYRVQVIPPAGSVITLRDIGDDDLDSDVDPVTGFTDDILGLVPGQSNLSIDAGIVTLVAGISVEKATNGQDADTGTGQLIIEGSTVTWTYVVSNTGGSVLVNISLNDDKQGAVTCPKTTLAVGEEMTCTKTGIAAIGLYANVGTVTGTPATPDGTPIPGVPSVTDDDPSRFEGVSVFDSRLRPPTTPTPVPPTSTPVPLAPTPTPTPVPLAVTGSGSSDLAAVATGLILAGIAVVALGRRRLFVGFQDLDS